MGVLHLSDNIDAPAHLWARRMLEAIGDDVVTLACEPAPPPKYAQRYNVLNLWDPPPLWPRLLKRMHLTQHNPWEHRDRERLLNAVAADSVSVVFVQYLTYGVRYDWAWRQTAKPVFVHCHGYDTTWDFRTYDAPEKRFHSPDYVDRVRALPSNVHLIACSYTCKERLLAIGIPEHRIRVKYYGVDVPETPPAPRPGSRVNILYLGRLIDCKGPDLTIRAFDRACQRGLDGQLIVAGDGVLRITCELERARARYPDRIQLLGAVDSATGIELRANAHIFTTHNCLGPISRQEESFGVSFAEAMAEGMPIVSGRNGSLPEVIEDGVHGILVEPGDIDAHADALLRLASDPDLRAQMGRSGWERVRDNWSLQNEVNQLRSILGLQPETALLSTPVLQPA
jgi:glycosyltransferase involved in cell wall biosynthesis